MVGLLPSGEQPALISLAITRELELVAGARPEVECHVLPARGTSARDDSLTAFRDTSGVTRRIEATYDATRAYLAEHDVAATGTS